jgi:hypothetical protein
MLRNAILAVVLATGAGTVAAAYPPPHPGPEPVGIEGRWFMAGDLTLPCYIEFLPRRGGTALVLTNERGEQSRGRLLPGQRIIADDWPNGMTGLIGDVRGNEIFWRNGDRWTR